MTRRAERTDALRDKLMEAETGRGRGSGSGGVACYERMVTGEGRREQPLAPASERTGVTGRKAQLIRVYERGGMSSLPQPHPDMRLLL